MKTGSFRTCAGAALCALFTLLAGCGPDEVEALPQEGLAPLTLPPSGTHSLIWVQQQKLLASDGEAWGTFGAAVDVDGSSAIIGAPGATSGVIPKAGAAYVFVRSGSTWKEEAKLVAPDAEQNALFGVSVGIHGDTAIVGSSFDNEMGQDAGAAYVFTRSGGVWSLQQKLVSPGPGYYKTLFGHAVDVHGDTALVTALTDTTAVQESGAAYVFVRNGGAWSVEAKLVPQNSGVLGYFGQDAELEGDTALIGAPSDSEQKAQAGAAYVFARSGGTWSQQAKLSPGDLAANDQFGWSVSLSGDLAVAGAIAAKTGGFMTGAAYLFARSGSAWAEETKLLGFNLGDGDDFGYFAAISGELVLIGAPLDDDTGTDSGAAYAFRKNLGGWYQDAKIIGVDMLPLDQFQGERYGSVALSGETAIIGAKFDDDLGSISGSAYAMLMPQPNGKSCTQDAECESGACSDGVCCDNYCGGPCNVCTAALGASADGICTPLPPMPCDDEDACTEGDTCNGGFCQGTPKTCPDSTACETWHCWMGECRSTMISEAPCPGGVCQGGVCQPDPTGSGSGSGSGSGGGGGGGSGCDCGCLCAVGARGPAEASGAFWVMAGAAAIWARRRQRTKPLTTR